MHVVDPSSVQNDESVAEKGILVARVAAFPALLLTLLCRAMHFVSERRLTEEIFRDGRVTRGSVVEMRTDSSA